MRRHHALHSVYTVWTDTEAYPTYSAAVPETNVLKLFLFTRCIKVKNIVCAEVYQCSVLLHLRLNPDSVNLKPNFIEDVRAKGHWGTGDLRIVLRSMEDFEQIKPLLDRAYNEN